MPRQWLRNFHVKQRKLPHFRKSSRNNDCSNENRKDLEFLSPDSAERKSEGIEKNKVENSPDCKPDVHQKQLSLSEVFILHLSICPSTQKVKVSPVSSSQLNIENQTFNVNNIQEKLIYNHESIEESFECIYPGEEKERSEKLDRSIDFLKKTRLESHNYISVETRCEGKDTEEDTMIISPETKSLSNAYDNITSSKGSFCDEFKPFNGISSSSCGDYIEEQKITPIPPSEWPQSPLLLRPTPGSGTRIRGIRYSSTDNYVGDCNRDQLTQPWWQSLQTEFDGNNDLRTDKKKREQSSGCNSYKNCCLPINNGNESIGQSLVVDFESDLFEGTLLLRIRNCKSLTTGSYDDTFGYFSNLNRQFQAVIIGKFKKPGIPVVECVAGNAWSSPLAKLPPKVVLNGAIKLASIFAPQVKISLQSQNPYSLAPLGSAPQVIIVDKDQKTKIQQCKKQYAAGAIIDESRVEPLDYSKSIMCGSRSLGKSFHSNNASSVARAKKRKKAFDKLYSVDDKSLKFQTDAVYTFEFLQHLLDFNEYHVDLGRIFGHLSLENSLYGQPIQIMAGHQKVNRKNRAGNSEVKDLSRFWSFDICHEKLFKKN